MKVTYAQVKDLQEAMSGAVACRMAGENEPDNISGKYHIGAVWYGDWYRKADEGRFGTEQKPNHNAIIRKRSRHVAFFGMAPVTSHEDTRSMALPVGMIPGGKLCQSYVMTRVFLRASRTTLDRHFEYKCCLPPHYVEAMQRHGGG